MRLPTSVLLISLAACGGSSKPAATGPANTGDGAADGAAPAAGSTGLPGLDWGASTEAVLATNPRATASADGATVSAVAPVDGKNAITVYEIGASGLAMISIEWTDGFVSMDDCSGGWKDKRATLDARLGSSQSDNLAAYWETPTASVTLACNPNDSGAGVLSLTYAPRQAE
ncbi:MAG: hypothetical protein JNK64_41210 [Myxococcales bacterium]|nr:hypothetical protein [Myxococcales bacterium]